MLILVPETTSEPTLTGRPESARNGFIRTVKATPERKTAAVVSGTATRKMRTCRLWRTAARKARVVSVRPNRATPRGPPGLTSDTAVKEFIPEPPSAQENQAAPLDISLFWRPMVAPKYGPGAARPRRTTAEDPAGKSGLLKEIARTSYPIHTIPKAGNARNGERCPRRPSRRGQALPGPAGSENRPPRVRRAPLGRGWRRAFPLPPAAPTPPTPPSLV